MTLGLSHSATYRQRHAMGIYPRPRFLIDKAVLGKLYLNEKKSTYEIATLFGFCNDTILDQLRYYKIPVRTFGEGVRLAAQNGR